MSDQLPDVIPRLLPIPFGMLVSPGAVLTHPKQSVSPVPVLLVLADRQLSLAFWAAFCFHVASFLWGGLYGLQPTP